ncbi:HEPN domain-containing protein [Candidatus Woesearchaeota archaeon]|nr:HEPN domain-containing protein [Candidatus Woesearchaeota archaeon]
MINSFENYLKIGKVKRKTPDPEEAKALLSKALDRLEYLNNQNINDNTAKFILEDSYEAARGAAQALMSLRGFKPYLHEATISFIKEFFIAEFQEEDIYTFDRFRRLRNDSIYKAVEITKEDAKVSLLFAKKFIQKIKRIQS